ncbi:hypothetical protein AB0G04_34085 [Actinoplanes sp. NPDC023801]|uniref:hypothetical protein n=1 Tax=Actinoplanes sp. NPDC023801 TaxID=3154595 RepID=UPI003406F909
MRWYEPAARASGIADRWLAAAREHLPEAMPRRFGDTEPLRGRLDRDGEDGFRRAHERADSLLHLAGTAPIYSASLAANRPRWSGRPPRTRSAPPAARSAALPPVDAVLKDDGTVPGPPQWVDSRWLTSGGPSARSSARCSTARSAPVSRPPC